MNPILKPVLGCSYINLLAFFILKLILLHNLMSVNTQFYEALNNYTQYTAKVYQSKSQVNQDANKPSLQNLNELIMNSQEKQQLVNSTFKIFQNHNFKGTWNKFTHQNQQFKQQSFIQTDQSTWGIVYLQSIQFKSTSSLHYHLQTVNNQQITLSIMAYNGLNGQKGADVFQISFDPYYTLVKYQQSIKRITIQTTEVYPILLSKKYKQYRSIFKYWPLYQAKQTKFGKFSLSFTLPQTKKNANQQQKEYNFIENFSINFNINQYQTDQNKNKYLHNFKFQLKEEVSYSFFWKEIIFFFIISHLLSITAYLVLKIGNDPNQFHTNLIKISYYSVIPKFMLDTAISIQMIIAVFLTPSYYQLNMASFSFAINAFVLIGVGTYAVTSYMTQFWLLLVLREHLKGHQAPWDRVYHNPDRNQIRNLAIITLLAATLSLFFYFGYFFILIYSLRPSIQIYFNVMHRFRPKLRSQWYQMMIFQLIGIVFARNSFLNPYDMQSLIDQVGIFGFIFLLAIIAIQFYIIYLQEKKGPTYFLPKILRPKYDGYNYKYILEEHKSSERINSTQQSKQKQEQKSKQMCAICLMQLSEDVSKIMQKKINQKWTYVNYNVMRTPCNHYYHSLCLLEWMQEKMQCPKCRIKLPPVLQQ